MVNCWSHGACLGTCVLVDTLTKQPIRTSIRKTPSLPAVSCCSFVFVHRYICLCLYCLALTLAQFCGTSGTDRWVSSQDFITVAGLHVHEAPRHAPHSTRIARSLHEFAGCAKHAILDCVRTFAWASLTIWWSNIAGHMIEGRAKAQILEPYPRALRA